VVDYELAAAVEEVVEGFGGPVRGGERVWFCDGEDGKGATLFGEGVLGAGEVLFFLEEGFAGGEPFGGRCDLRCGG
jgi:hypothetical protein